MLILPVRTAVRSDIANGLALWLDTAATSSSQQKSNNPPPDFSGAEVRDDLQRLDQLRSTIVSQLAVVASTESSSASLQQPQETSSSLESTLQEYHACLMECEQRGIGISPMFHSSSSSSSTADSDADSILQLSWKSAFVAFQAADEQIGTTVLWERAGVLWNLAALEAHQASLASPSDKRALSKAVKQWQLAASYMVHAKTTISINPAATNSEHNDDNHKASRNGKSSSVNVNSKYADFSIPMMTFWEKILLGQAQMAGYEMAHANPRPRHLLLAKLATAVVPLLKEAQDACQLLSATATNTATSGSGGWNDNDHHGSNAETDPDSLLDSWNVYLKGCGFLYAAKAEWHESVAQKDKMKWGMELARLEKGLSLANTCQDILMDGATNANRRRHRRNGASSSAGYHNSSNGNSVPSFLQDLTKSLEECLQLLTARYQEAQQQHPDVPIPPPNEVRDIRGESLVGAKSSKSSSSSSSVPSLPPACVKLVKPLFSNVLGDAARSACDVFRRDMDGLVQQMAQMVDSKTESAREQLAAVNLPHSLTAYKQEQSGGGIPMDLWNRVDQIQQDRTIATLKRDLWELRDVAEQARSIFERTRSTLEEDVTIDQTFRRQHAGFDGHSVNEVQRSFRTSLSNYEKLLAKSQEGDAVLLRRLEILDTDPKYKLLQFQKSQLDRLLPGNKGSGSSSSIDTTHLSRRLVDLSSLIHEREMTLNLLRREVRNYNIKARVVDIDPDGPNASEQYAQAVQLAKKSFSGIAFEIQTNVDKQVDFIEEIMLENDRFMRERDAAASATSGRVGAGSAASDSCIAMIEDAIDEIQQLSRHLVDGRAFYDVVIPKLETLKQQVGDASVRLAVERCEFEDKAWQSVERRRQEEEDARMAASLAGGQMTASALDGSSSSSAAAASASMQPLSVSGMTASDMHGHMSSGNMSAVDASATIIHPGHATITGSAMTHDQPIEDIAPDVARPRSHPGVVTVAHDEPQVRVDDEKVASLVSMGFDPDKIVQALRKYDNNVEQALNELVSG